MFVIIGTLSTFVVYVLMLFTCGMVRYAIYGHELSRPCQSHTLLFLWNLPVQRIKISTLVIIIIYYGSTLVVMSGIGSVFLGDNQRFRMLSSTPPSSPTRSPASFFPTISPSQSPKQSFSKATAPPPVIDSTLSLELRLRWLEAILLGVRQDAKDRKGKEKLNELKYGETLIRLAEDVQRRMDIAVEGNDGLKRFMDHCT